ncbi:MAG: DUF805 domain-containing protein, partial [Deferribacteraceae bacterium]|nr:DUF805 domain-containing protein [Deferribacteraceae bacterium]
MNQNFNARSADLKKQLETFDFKGFFTTNTGRINRKIYIFYYFLPSLAVAIVLGLIIGLLAALITPQFLILARVFAVIINLAGIMPGVKRLHDMNYTG